MWISQGGANLKESIARTGVDSDAEHRGWTVIRRREKRISKQALLLHDESLAEHGGASGLRDEGLLESAPARPRNLAASGSPDVADLAAAYGVGLAKNHAFVDGNKHAAFLAVGLFAALNGVRLVATQKGATLTMLDLASGDLDEQGFAQWLRAHLHAQTSKP
jgi:death on curing protein